METQRPGESPGGEIKQSQKNGESCKEAFFSGTFPMYLGLWEPLKRSRLTLSLRRSQKNGENCETWKGSRKCHPKSCHCGLRIILNWRMLRRSRYNRSCLPSNKWHYGGHIFVKVCVSSVRKDRSQLPWANVDPQQPGDCARRTM